MGSKVEPPDGQDTRSLSASIKKYFESTRFSDLTIKAGDREYKVHKMVVCAHSEYFDTLFQKEWKEQSEIHLQEDDPLALHAMVQFMYGLEYDQNGDGRCSPMRFNIKIYQVADKYQVPELKKQAKEKFESIVKTSWSMDDFSTAIEEVYDTTPEGDRGLRDPIVDIAHKHIEELWEKDSFTRVFRERCTFAESLAESLIRPSSSIKKYQCPKCYERWKWESLDERHVRKPVLCPMCGYRSHNWDPYLIE